MPLAIDAIPRLKNKKGETTKTLQKCAEMSPPSRAGPGGISHGFPHFYFLLTTSRVQIPRHCQTQGC